MTADDVSLIDSVTEVVRALGPEVVPSIPTLIPHLHLTYIADIDGWTVTQVPSGKAITSYGYSLRDVINALPALDGLDWSNPHGVGRSELHRAAYKEFRARCEQ